MVVSRQATTAPEAVSERAATIGSWRPAGFKQITTIVMTAVCAKVETLTMGGIRMQTNPRALATVAEGELSEFAR